MALAVKHTAEDGERHKIFSLQVQVRGQRHGPPFGPAVQSALLRHPQQILHGIDVYVLARRLCGRAVSQQHGRCQQQRQPPPSVPNQHGAASSFP